MAKRWVIQKRLKEKRYREKSRGVMKRLSAESINCGRSPNKEVMSWYKNSANSLGWCINFQDVVKHNVNQPRAEALKLADTIRNACPEWKYFRLLDDCFVWARMYFQNNPERCCILEYDKRRKVLRRSIVYRNRDVAYQRWYGCTIDWVNSTDLYHPNIPETHNDN